jgi:hypothetical protein
MGSSSIKCPVCKAGHAVSDPSKRTKCPKCGHWINFLEKPSLSIRCPRCLGSFVVKETLIGRKVKCRCGGIFRIDFPLREERLSELLNDSLPVKKEVPPPQSVPVPQRTREEAVPERKDMIMALSGAIVKLLVGVFILGVGVYILIILYNIFFCEFAPPSH